MAYGLEPVKAAGTGAIRPNVWGDYTIASAYNTALFEGDAVKLVTAGDIERAAANEPIVGVFWGVQYTDSDGNEVFRRDWPASTVTLGSADAKAVVYDDPNIVFKIQSDQDTTALVKADIGGNIDITVGTGSTVSKKSGTYVDSSAGVGTGTAQLRIMGSAELDGAFTAAGTAMDVYVRIIEHFNSSATGI
jgi:hypothetical protein